jgi:hypothetical protein
MVTSIFYIFPSGDPQPSDFILLLGFLVSLLVWGAFPKEPPLYLALGLLLSWIILVNGFWFMMTGEFQFLKKTSFYIYNSVVLAFVVFLGFHDFERLKKIIWWSCIVALCIQISYLELVPAGTKRAYGTFNNPNQLGYWSLLMMTCLVLVRERVRLGVVDVLAICAGMYATMLSLSKAAIISSVLVLALAIAGRGVRRPAGWLLGSVLAAGLALQLSTGKIAERIASLDLVAAVAGDLSTLEEEGQEDIGTRGYQRLVRYPQYLFLGAGEGDFARFGTGGRSERGERDREFHSSLGNLLLSYGIVGLMLFMALLVIVCAGAPWLSIFYLFPIMLFGLTHNGLRFSMFWVFLGLIFAQGHYGAGSGTRAARP